MTRGYLGQVIQEVSARHFLLGCPVAQDLSPCRSDHFACLSTENSSLDRSTSLPLPSSPPQPPLFLLLSSFFDAVKDREREIPPTGGKRVKKSVSPLATLSPTSVTFTSLPIPTGVFLFNRLHLSLSSSFSTSLLLQPFASVQLTSLVAGDNRSFLSLTSTLYLFGFDNQLHSTPSLFNIGSAFCLASLSAYELLI